MATGQLKLIREFRPYENVTHKADSFIASLDQLEALSLSIQNLIKTETAKSSGKMIETLQEVSDKNTNENQLYYDACKTSMKNMAIKYNDIANDMNSQSMTLYYDIIEMNPKE
jgi:hypothetical protein